MKLQYECEWCNSIFDTEEECAAHEKSCHENPDNRCCETCFHHGTVAADTGKIWYTCAIGLLTSNKWRENYAVMCPKWKSSAQEFDAK